VIDVNDVSPHFERSVYVAEIPEEEDAGFAVVKVTALDEDSGKQSFSTKVPTFSIKEVALRLKLVYELSLQYYIFVTRISCVFVVLRFSLLQWCLQRIKAMVFS